MDDDYKNLTRFWDNSFILNDDNKEEMKKRIDVENDWKDFSPSSKLTEALGLFKDNVLDYGCGNGWASIIMAKNGIKNIKACDVVPNSIKLLNFYKDLFNISNEIDASLIDSNWLSKEEINKYDGVFCSNVIDVLPLEMSKEIIEGIAKVAKKGATVIFSLNYYIDISNVKNKAFEVKNSQIYIDNVLRLTSLSDDEWKNIFEKYFVDVKLSYFSWSGEEKESRRLFVMKKN